MKLLFRQRLFRWFDSYDVYYEDGTVAFTVEGKLSWGHKLHILNAGGGHIATVKQTIFALLPRFELYEGNNYIGCVRKKWTFFSNNYAIDFRGWQVRGDVFGWNYEIVDQRGYLVASICKKLWNFTDTYVIDVTHPADTLHALMFTLAIDAEKCSQGNN